MTTLIAKETSPKLPFQAGASVLSNVGGSLSEAYLSMRMAKEGKPAKDVVFEFTNDPGLLHQYYRLREDMFISVWGLNRYSGAEETFDGLSNIMVARQGLHTIGGGRMTISTPSNLQPVPMEKADFSLKNALPELDLAHHTYCEFSRLAILPDFRAGKVFPEMAARFIRRAVAEGVEYAFNMAPLPLARNYRQAMKPFGLNWNIRSDIKIPDREEFEGIQMVLSVMNLVTIKNRHLVEDEAQTVKQPELLSE